MFPLRLITEFAHTKLSEAEKAMDWFLGDESPPEDDNEIWPQFNEWLNFDYKQTNGMTFLTEFVLKDPFDLGNKLINSFKQIGETQFYSLFEIGEVNPGKWLMLEDVYSGKVYKVYDKLLSEGLGNSTGSFYNRLAKVDNKWHLVGANPQVFPVTNTERMKKMLRRNPPKEGELSPKIIADSILDQRKKPSKPIKKLNKKEIDNKRKTLEKKYEEKVVKHKVRYPFEKLVKKIYSERGRNVANFFLRIAKDGLTEKFVFTEFKLMQDLWNFFPHKQLGDKCPQEMFQKYLY